MEEWPWKQDSTWKYAGTQQPAGQADISARISATERELEANINESWIGYNPTYTSQKASEGNPPEDPATWKSTWKQPMDRIDPTEPPVSKGMVIVRELPGARNIPDHLIIAQEAPNTKQWDSP